MRNWTPQQAGVFAAVVDGTGNVIVRARAGTGKTTTILEAVKRYLAKFPGRKVIVCAFNKKIADELTARFKKEGVAAEARTLHSLGNAALRRYWPTVRTEGRDNAGERKRSLTDAVCKQAVPDTLKTLVSKLHTLGREVAPLAQSGADLIDLAERFECVPDEQWQAQGWTTERIADYAYRAMVLAAEVKPTFTDYADMIYLPIRNGWLFGTADLIVVDEAQDMTPAQLIIALGNIKKGGRVVIVGDDRQAIYSFRGADSGCLDRLKAELNADEHGLTETFRCGRVIVAEAATMVPDFTAGATNPEGEILGMTTDEMAAHAAPGDFILSRKKAPTVSTAIRLLRAGKRAHVAGSDIGKGLSDLVARLTKSAKSVPAFLDRLEGWAGKEMARAKTTKNPDPLIDEILDKKEMLASLADGARSVDEILDRIAYLFKDDGLGQAGTITVSTIHKAKGLEANRVFILAETLRTGDIEEENLRYVAVTRAKQTLVWVADQAA